MYKSERFGGFVFSRQARAGHNSRQKRDREAATEKRLIIEEIDNNAAGNEIIISLILASRPFAQGGLSESLKEINSSLNASVAPFSFLSLS